MQEIGSVLTCEGRLLAFPNVFQHCVAPFSLADPSKPGHRKILALFLVDPNLPVLSTANVPPQQRDWWIREVASSSGAIGDLPVELIDMVGNHVQDFPIGLEEAKRIREDLMAERGKLEENVDKAVQENEFSFCEH